MRAQSDCDRASGGLCAHGSKLVWSGQESVIEYIPMPNPGVEGRHPITNYVQLSGKTHRVLRERGRRGLAWDELGRQCSTVFSKALIHSGGHGDHQARPTSKSRFGAGFLGGAWMSSGVAGPDDDRRGWTSRHARSDPRFTRPTRVDRRWDRRAVRRNRGTHRGCWS